MHNLVVGDASPAWDIVWKFEVTIVIIDPSSIRSYIHTYVHVVILHHVTIM